MSIEKRFERFNEILSRIGAKINQSIQDADTLIEGIAQYLDWLVFDKLNLTQFAIISETEIRVNNAHIAQNLVSSSIADEIKRLDESVNQSVNDGLMNVRSFIQTTFSLVNSMIENHLFMTTSNMMNLLEDISEYYSPSTLVQVSSTSLLLDKMQQVFAPTPDQLIAFQNKYQDLMLKGQEKLWKGAKPKK